MGEQSVSGHRVHGKVDAVVRLVGHSPLDELLDEGDHAFDEGGGVRDLVGPEDAERVDRVPPHLLVDRRESPLHSAPAPENG